MTGGLPVACSKMLHTAKCSDSYGGKVVHYMLRYVSPAGQKDPWSETVSATTGA